MPESEKIYPYLFENEPYDAAKFHHASNYLTRVVEDYLAWDSWRQDSFLQKLNLLQACRARRLNKPFRQVLRQSHQFLENSPARDARYLRGYYKLALEEYQFSMPSGRSNDAQLQALSSWHDKAFIAEKLKNACVLLSRHKVLQQNYQTGLLPAVLQLVQDNPELLDHPAIAVYYFGYRTLTEPQTEANFFELKTRLVAAEHVFPLQELQDIYLLAINFCIHRINLREEKWLREVFELYQSGLQSGVFFQDGRLSRFTYTNIALAALRLREFEWTYQFLHDYQNKLPEAQQAGAFAFNLARYYCEQGDYDRAMPLLQSMDFDDILHNLTAKAMLIRMYYETGAINALDSLLNSLETYLRRKGRLGEQQKLAYQATVRFVRKMSALAPSDKKARQQLRTDVENAALVAEKDWLLRMLK